MLKGGGMNYIDSLPHELLYQVLFYIPYDDIVSYGITSKSSTIIFHDDYNIFWMNKLNYKFGFDGFKPSDYVNRYGHPDRRGIDIYKRWSMDLGYGIKNGYNDSVIWSIHKQEHFYKGQSRNYDLRFADAVSHNNIGMLEFFEQRGVFPLGGYAYYAAQNGCFDVLHWLERRGILPGTRGQIPLILDV